MVFRKKHILISAALAYSHCRDAAVTGSISDMILFPIRFFKYKIGNVWGFLEKHIVTSAALADSHCRDAAVTGSISGMILFLIRF